MGLGGELLDLVAWSERVFATHLPEGGRCGAEGCDEPWPCLTRRVARRVRMGLGLPRPLPPDDKE